MSWLSKGLKKAERWIGSKIPHTSAAEKRAQMQATKEQMDLYKEQKETLHQAAEDLAKQKETERQKLNEQQIRSLRRNFRRSSGFMGTPEGQVKDTLG